MRPSSPSGRKTGTRSYAVWSASIPRTPTTRTRASAECPKPRWRRESLSCAISAGAGVVPALIDVTMVCHNIYDVTIAIIAILYYTI